MEYKMGELVELYYDGAGASSNNFITSERNYEYYKSLHLGFKLVRKLNYGYDYHWEAIAGERKNYSYRAMYELVFTEEFKKNSKCFSRSSNGWYKGK